MQTIDLFDQWLQDNGPAALVLREHLMPVDGPDGVLFPATFAAGGGFPGGYNIDGPPDGENVCIIDTVGSQANRLEPLFLKEPYKRLVPQIVVTLGQKEVNLLEAGHRAGDAVIRCSALGDALQKAFKAVLSGDADPLARVAPTSLVFGVWDSRDTQAKAPRVVASTIRAFNVRVLTRSAVYIPPVDYAAEEVFSEEDKAKAEGDAKSPLAKRGFVHVPATGHGGVIATGGVRRDAALGLAALRLLRSCSDAQKTLALQRYLLGLALVVFTANPSSYLRQGCILVRNPAKAHDNEFVEVYPDGRRVPCNVDHEAALEYAKAAADAFGVGESKTVPFDRQRAKKEVAESKEKPAKNKKQKREDDSGDSD